MEITPDAIIYWQWNGIYLNATIVFSWLVMLLLALISYLATKNLTIGPKISKWQNALEIIISYIRQQIREITQQEPDQFLPFLASIFLYISLANFLTILPGYNPPTGSLSTTSALAICVFFAVPIFGISKKGVKGFLKNYLEPSVLMLPFNVIGDLSRTLSMSIRLFGNIMSGTMIVAVLLSLVPLLFPIVMSLFGLLIGQIQAYIFAILAAVYIGSATRIDRQKEKEKQKQKNNKEGSEEND